MDTTQLFFSPYMVAGAIALILLTIGVLMGRKAKQMNNREADPWVVGCIMFIVCGLTVPAGIAFWHNCNTREGNFIYLQYGADGTPITEYQCRSNARWPDNINVVPRPQLERSFAMRAHPITANPKVHNLAYKVDTKVADFNKFYRGRPISRVDAGSELEHWTRKTLFEFNEQRSKELSAFYNPLDDAQQAQFATLLTNFAQPILAEHGITVVLTRFDIE